MQSDILFDNIYVGHSIEDAETLRKETFDIKQPIEKSLEEAASPKPSPDEEEGTSFRQAPLAFIREKVDTFIYLAKESPVAAIKEVPEVSGSLAVLLVTLTLITVGAIKISTPAPAPAPKKEKGTVSESKEKAAEAVRTAAENAKGEATKRSGKGPSSD